jgi:hypothetical protein
MDTTETATRPTWDDSLPESYAEAAHADICFPVCHQNLMEVVDNALRACWAEFEAKGKA